MLRSGGIFDPLGFAKGDMNLHGLIEFASSYRNHLRALSRKSSSR
jgi:hypothetical protein